MVAILSEEVARAKTEWICGAKQQIRSEGQKDGGVIPRIDAEKSR
jgi:hypothetical protein